MKLNKGQMRTYEALAEQLSDARENLRDAVIKYNLELRAVHDFATAVGEHHRAVWDERSESWQESDAGARAAEFVEAWEGLDVEEFEEPEDGDFEELPIDSEDE